MNKQEASSGSPEGAFLKLISDYQLIHSGDRVLIAFSGGPDSVFLTELFLKYRSVLGIDIALGYVQHSLRGEASRAEEDFVRDYAADQKIELFTESVDPRAEQASAKQGLEAAARKLRYAALIQMADRYGAGPIATAHHLNDLMETLLYRIFKGASPEKAAGLAPKRGRLIRPILGCRKEKILEWLSGQNIRYCLDATNADPSYDRNYIRGHLVPPILSRFESAPEKIWDFCAAAWEDEADWKRRVREILEQAVRTDDGFSIPREVLFSLSDALLTRVLVAMAKEAAGEEYHSSRRRWLKLRERVRETRVHGTVVLDADRFLKWKLEYDTLKLSKIEKIFPENEKYVKINTEVSGEYPEFGFSLIPFVEGKKGIDGSGNQYVRRSKPGDRFRIAGNCRKKVQDELVDRKVPREKRGCVHVIVRSSETDGLPNEEILAIIVPETWIRVAYGAMQSDHRRAYRLEWMGGNDCPRMN